MAELMNYNNVSLYIGDRQIDFGGGPNSVLERMERTISASLNDLNTRITELSNTVSSLSETVAQHTTSIADLTTRIQALET